MFIGYQDGSKAYHFYDPVAERVHVSRDAIFDEGARWEWTGASTSSDQEPFIVEYEYELRRQPSAASTARTASPTPGSPPTPEAQPASPPPATPSAPTGVQVEFVTPLTNNHNLDADDDEDLEHRYRMLENVLGTNTVPGLAHRDVEDAELHNVSVEGPSPSRTPTVIQTGTPQWRRS